MTELRFWGAAGVVTGSCHQVDFDSARVLVDCGMFQGEDARRNREFSFDAGSIDAVVLTHAHVDHVGRLPCLFKKGYRGRVWCTPATAELAGIMLEDGLQLQDGMYDRRDMERALGNMVPVEYGQKARLPGNLHARFHDAGHILGSASVELVGDASILFSGDLGSYDNPLLRTAHPPQRADVVVLEATYGSRRRNVHVQLDEELGKAIRETFDRGGNVVIPAFAVERTQDLLLALARLSKDGAILPEHIYLDSPMGVAITELFCEHQDQLDPRAGKESGSRACPLYPPGLEFCRTVDQSRQINKVHSHVVIIASGGMCEGGRIVHHLKRNIGRPECSIVFVGYQARGTLGRQILDGARSVHLLGDAVPVQAKIQEIEGLSAHADQGGLLDWLHSMERPDRVFLVHGEDDGLSALKDVLSKEGYSVDIPALGETVQL